MGRVKGTGLIVCDGCGVEITWTPVVRQKRIYCCRACAQGLSCECDSQQDLEAIDRRLSRLDFLPD